MNVATGIMNEDRIFEALNNKKIKNLSNNMRDLMEHLFGLLDPDETVKAIKTCEFVKPDIMIVYKGITKGLSIKSEKSQVIHSEQVNMFAKILKKHNISNETIKTILLFHYGDGTINGTGKKRFGYTDIQYHLKNRIKAANEELTKSYETIVSLLNYCVFEGVREEAEKADAIYVGDVDFGYVATKEQIRRWINNKRWSYYDNLHIGPLLMNPHARYIDKEVKNEKFRNQIDLYWPKLFNDISYISRHYNYYDTPYKSWKDKHGE